MAGETIKSEAVCLGIHPFSRTSHVVRWLTPVGEVLTSVKGAVRPKSAFLGQYDLNYTNEIVYYARAKGELHALRETTPLERRDALRRDYRALLVAEHARRLVRAYAPGGSDCRAWYDLLTDTLDRLPGVRKLPEMLGFEMDVLRLAGLSPAFDADALQLRGERAMPVSAETLACLRNPRREKNLKILLDAARVIGVFYMFHLDCAPTERRTVLRMIWENEQEG